MSDKNIIQNLILRHLNEPDNELLIAEVEAFRVASSENENYYQQLKRIWDAAQETRRLSGINYRASIKNFRNKLKDRKTEHSHARNFDWLKYAAIIILVSMVSLWTYLKENVVNYVVKETSSQIDSVKLSDGSKIMLAENTSIRFPEKFTGDTRKISLVKGQAFFKVNKDPEHPFVIAMGPSTVTVLGTSFNINYSNLSIDVAVSTGKVMFMSNKASSRSILVAGEALTYRIQENSIERLSGVNANAWYTNELFFVDMPLVDVCKELTKHFKLNIKLEDHTQSTKKFNANFKESSLTEILEVLKATYKMNITTHGDTITIKTIQ